jgi:hypothetical protein
MTYSRTFSSSSAPCTSKSPLSAVRRGDRRFQNDDCETRTETEQKPCKLVRQNGENFIRTQPSCISMPDFAVIKGIVSPMLAPATHQRVHDVTTYLPSKNKCIVDEMYNMHKCIIQKIKISLLPAPKYSIQSLYTALHHRQQSQTQLRCSRSYQEPTPCLCYPTSCLQTHPHLLPGTAQHHTGAETPPCSRRLKEHKCHCRLGALICL